MRNKAVKLQTIFETQLPLKTFSIALALGFTALIGASIFWNLRVANNHVKEIAKAEARSNFNKDLAIRSWASRHGGVYVPMNARTPANPYLVHIPYREIPHPNGSTQTLMNPAYMIRQMFDEFPKKYGVVGHIVSLKPLNPNNTPDEWERNALLSFEKGSKEVFEFSKLNGKEYLRLIQPLITENDCLKCHEHQGYKVGDIRGGIGVSIPMEQLWIVAHNEKTIITIWHFIFLIIGYTGIALAYVVIKRSIIKHKQAEGALRLARFSVENASDAMYLMKADGSIVNVNNAACHMLGYNRSELLQLSVPDVDANYSKEVWQQHFPELKKLSTLKFESMHRTKDGRLLPVEIVANYLLFEDEEYDCAFVRDITARKQTEKEHEKLQTQLAQAQKMESVGRLAGGVAHDFNNMLGVILGHTEMLLERVDLDQTVHEDLTEIKKATMRSADLTRQLLAFARKQVVSPKVLDLNKTVDNMLMMIKRLIGENIELAWFPGKDLSLVNIDPSQIDQMLANLCINARDAIVDVGKITIETGNVIFDENYCSENPGFIPGEFVLLAVSDDGGGMDQKTLDQVFEPFFTTKELGKGTGLGLSTVYGIVKQNNGFINAYSELTQGTAFKIYLPRHIGKNEQILKNGSPEPDMRGHETILLVEDEPAILNMTKIMLERMGYHVLTANSPGEAMRLAEINAGQIHLLMTDVVMPKMNGRDLAKNILALYPNLKCLFMSGYTANVIAHQGVLDEGTYFIQKPFSKKDLAVMVRSALE